MEVDPDDPLNAVIVNLDRAPRNERGMVEFSAPFFIIKPVDMARGNRKLLYGINNRGNAIELPFQTFPSLPAGADPESGDGLFFRLGYTFVDAGWAGDVTTTATRLGANLPVAMQADGQPDRLPDPDRVSVGSDGGRHRRPYPSAQGKRPLRELRVGPTPMRRTPRSPSATPSTASAGRSRPTAGRSARAHRARRRSPPRPPTSASSTASTRTRCTS